MDIMAADFYSNKAGLTSDSTCFIYSADLGFQ